jgi:hypothetical protein
VAADVVAEVVAIVWVLVDVLVVDVEEVSVIVIGATSVTIAAEHSDALSGVVGWWS